MDLEAFIEKMKAINSALVDFLDAPDDSEYEQLVDVMNMQDILQSNELIRILLELISKIADNHHRSPGFFDKIERILQYLIQDNLSPISYFIPDYTSYNKRILYLLLEKGFIKPDESFINKYLLSKTNKIQLYHYLYPKMKKYLEEKIQEQIEKEILIQYEEEISTFEEKCQIGENDSYICSLIRSDSVEEFISYVNRTNFSLSRQIKRSIYETNSFLIDKEPTLIEYASFFGSIQIIQYLKYNNVPLTFSLWNYAIHSNDAQIIHFLEENENKIKEKIEKKMTDESIDDILIESIKCHHNDFSNYICDNFYSLEMQENDQNQFYDRFCGCIAFSLNFFYFPNVKSVICRPRNDKGFKVYHLCLSLEKISIPSSVTSIGNCAFAECSLLTQIIIPSSVTEIKNSVFYKCSSLTHITIPSSVTKIGNNAFFECSALIEITIHSSVTSIGNFAFYRCSSLTQITIPSSVTSIGDYAFYGCSTLNQIIIPSSVTSIGSYAFYECLLLSKMLFELPSSITSIKKFTFYLCSSLAQISIPPSVTSIENNAFSGCSSLKQITIPSSVTSIEDFTFFECSSLTQMSIPPSVTKIKNFAFSRCSLLTQIIIPSSVTSIGNGAFDECSSLAQITIPSSVTSIGDYAFAYCSSLIQITIPSSVTEIENYAFKGCSLLTQITIPSSVKSIGDYAFSGCSSLIQITIPSSVSVIGDYAFSECSSLTQITMPSSCKARRIGIRPEANIIHNI